MSLFVQANVSSNDYKMSYGGVSESPWRPIWRRPSHWFVFKKHWQQQWQFTRKVVHQSKKKNNNDTAEKMIWKSEKRANPLNKTQPKRAHLLHHETAAQSYLVLHVAIGRASRDDKLHQNNTEATASLLLRFYFGAKNLCVARQNSPVLAGLYISSLISVKLPYKKHLGLLMLL